MVISHITAVGAFSSAWMQSAELFQKPAVKRTGSQLYLQVPSFQLFAVYTSFVKAKALGVWLPFSKNLECLRRETCKAQPVK